MRVVAFRKRLIVLQGKRKDWIACKPEGMLFCTSFFLALCNGSFLTMDKMMYSYVWISFILEDPCSTRTNPYNLIPVSMVHSAALPVGCKIEPEEPWQDCQAASWRG